MEVNPYQPPQYAGAQTCPVEDSLTDGERVVVQLAARSYSGKDRLFRIQHPMIGKFVLTNRRVLFLSSGKGEGIGFVPESVMVERIARPLDLTALEREGAWQFSVSEVLSAEEFKRSLMRGTCLRVVVRDESGALAYHHVYRNGAGQEMWARVAAAINRLRQGTAMADQYRTVIPERM